MPLPDEVAGEGGGPPPLWLTHDCPGPTCKLTGTLVPSDAEVLLGNYPPEVLSVEGDEEDRSPTTTVTLRFTGHEHGRYFWTPKTVDITLVGDQAVQVVGLVAAACEQAVPGFLNAVDSEVADRLPEVD